MKVIPTKPQIKWLYLNLALNDFTLWTLFGFVAIEIVSILAVIKYGYHAAGALGILCGIFLLTLCISRLRSLYNSYLSSALKRSS